MNCRVNKLPKSRMEICVEIPPEELKPFLEKAAVKVSEETKIDGFRPGKAPYEIIVGKVGEAAVLEAAADSIISKTYFQALKENKIVAIGQPKIDLEKMAPGNPFVYKAVVSILPKVKIGDYSRISLKRKEIEIKEEQVEKIIGDIRKMRAAEKLVEREAGKDDKLEIDFEVFRDKVPIENGKHRKYPIVIGENRFIPGFEEQLIGLKAGEIKEFELEFPDEYYQKNLAGKNAQFRVDCLGVYEIILPEVNDDFAKNVSGDHFNDVLSLKQNIRTNLEQEEKNKEEQRAETEILDKLIEISEFEELPDDLTDHEVQRMLHELEDNLARQGLKFEDYLSSINKTHDDLEKEFRIPAEKRVKTSILCREIFAQQKLAVTDDEVMKEIGEMLKSYSGNPEAAKQLETETYKDYLRNVLGNRKVMDYLKKEIIR